MRRTWNRRTGWCVFQGQGKGAAECRVRAWENEKGVILWDVDYSIFWEPTGLVRFQNGRFCDETT
jgi:hypothetical protein